MSASRRITDLPQLPANGGDTYIEAYHKGSETGNKYESFKYVVETDAGNVSHAGDVGATPALVNTKILHDYVTQETGELGVLRNKQLHLFIGMTGRTDYDQIKKDFKFADECTCTTYTNTQESLLGTSLMLYYIDDQNNLKPIIFRWAQDAIRFANGFTMCDDSVCYLHFVTDYVMPLYVEYKKIGNNYKITLIDIYNKGNAITDTPLGPITLYHPNLISQRQYYVVDGAKNVKVTQTNNKVKMTYKETFRTLIVQSNAITTLWSTVFFNVQCAAYFKRLHFKGCEQYAINGTSYDRLDFNHQTNTVDVYNPKYGNYDNYAIIGDPLSPMVDISQCIFSNLNVAYYAKCYSVFNGNIVKNCGIGIICAALTTVNKGIFMDCVDRVIEFSMGGAIINYSTQEGLKFFVYNWDQPMRLIRNGLIDWYMFRNGQFDNYPRQGDYQCWKGNSGILKEQWDNEIGTVTTQYGSDDKQLYLEDDFNLTKLIKFSYVTTTNNANKITVDQDTGERIPTTNNVNWGTNTNHTIDTTCRDRRGDFIKNYFITNTSNIGPDQNSGYGTDGSFAVGSIDHIELFHYMNTSEKFQYQTFKDNMKKFTDATHLPTRKRWKGDSGQAYFAGEEFFAVTMCGYNETLSNPCTIRWKNEGDDNITLSNIALTNIGGFGISPFVETCICANVEYDLFDFSAISARGTYNFNYVYHEVS